jgi:hypothetical protein
MSTNSFNLSSLPVARRNTDESAKADTMKQLTERIIGCAIEVQRQLGPGLLEGTYEAALSIESQ